jgi:hypothetical protein
VCCATACALPPCSGIVLRVLFHPKQLMLFSSDDQGEVRVWDLVTKAPAFKNMTKVRRRGVTYQVKEQYALKEAGLWWDGGGRLAGGGGQRQGGWVFWELVMARPIVYVAHYV